MIVLIAWIVGYAGKDAWMNAFVIAKATSVFVELISGRTMSSEAVCVVLEVVACVAAVAVGRPECIRHRLWSGCDWSFQFMQVAQVLTLAAYVFSHMCKVKR